MADALEKNKGGRPRGSGFRQEMYDKFVKPNSERMIKMGIELAMGGEPMILKFWLERMVPKNPMPTGMSLTGTPNEQMQKLLGHVTDGDVSCDDALKISTIVREKAMLEKLDAFGERMERLEKWIMERNDGQTIEHTKPASHAAIEIEENS